MDDKQLDMRNRIAEAVQPLATLLEEIMGAAPQATVGPPRDIDYKKLGESLLLNYEAIAEYIDMDTVADYVCGNLDIYDVAQNVDVSAIASEMDCDAVASCLETDAVASAIDMDDLSGYLDLQGYLPDTEAFVSEAMSDEFYVEAIAKAVAAEFIKRLTPKVEPATTNPDGQAPVSPDGQEPVNLSLSPDGTPVNNNDN